MSHGHEAPVGTDDRARALAGGVPRARAPRWSTTIADFLAALPERPVTPGETPVQVRAALGDGAAARAWRGPGGAARGGGPRCCATTRCSTGTRGSSATSPPRRRRSARSAICWRRRSTPTCGGWALAPMATEIEAQSVRWIAELIGYPSTAGGLLVSGGNMANFVGCPGGAAGERAVGRPRARRRGSRAASTCASTPRPRPTPGCRRPPTCSGSGPTASAGSRPTASSAWTSPRCAGDRRRPRGRGQPFLVVGTAGHGQHRRDRPTAASWPRSAGEAAVWFHVDGGLRRLRGRAARRAARSPRAAPGRLGGDRPAQVALRAARGGLRAGARPGGAARRLQPTAALLPLRRPGRRAGQLLRATGRRTRAASGR